MTSNNSKSSSASNSDQLVPIGVFWDIENCNVPRGKSALSLVQRIRDEFFTGHKEVEFMCVCDIHKENKDVIHELILAQVTVVHINATGKNAADDKLRQRLRQFANSQRPPASVVLLSGDINFASELSDLRHHYKLDIILVHPNHTQKALKQCAHKCFPYEELTNELPNRKVEKCGEEECELEVENLPCNKTYNAIQSRLKQLATNCGGKVVRISGKFAQLKFPNHDAAVRAQKRMNGEDVYGRKINVYFPSSGQSPRKQQFNQNPKKSQSPVLHTRSESPAANRSYSPKRRNRTYSYNAGYDRHDRPISPLVSCKDKPVSPLTGYNGRRHSPQSGHKSYYVYHRSNSVSYTHSGSPEHHQWNGHYHETKRQSYFRTQSLSPRHSPEKTSRPRPIRAKQPSPVSRRQYGSRDPSDKSGSPMGRPHSQIPGIPNANRRKVSIDDEANYTVHLVQTLEDDVYVTRGDSLERIDGAGAACSQYRQTAEGTEGYKKRVAYGLQADDRSDGDNQLFGNLKLEDSNYAPGGSLPWRMRTSPGPSRGDPSQRRVSPNFRRTPGASRPSSRTSYSSGGSLSSTRSSPFMGFGGNENSGSYFQPIRNQSPLLSAADLIASKESNMSDDMEAEDEYSEAQLMVTNLDYNISAREWKKILFTEFQQQVKVIGVHIQTQPDNTNVGYVKMHTIEDARYAISQFHRKKIGYKRIHVSLVNNDHEGGAPNVRSEVIALMKEFSGHSLPLFKFIEIFEKRYHRTISVSELYRMKDTVEIEELGSTGRTVSLLPGVSNSPMKDSLEDGQDEILESPVCKIHCKDGVTHYMEAFDATAIPTVRLQVTSFAAKVHTLLQIHDGSMPLVSFIACYSAEITKLETVSAGGVPLEHLISCVPGVKVAVCKTGIKKVQWAENKPPTSIEFGKLCNSPLLSQHLSQFTRDVVELLKHIPQCRMPFSKFIPNYHHHFGRQCRVADYGYTKLMELFDAIPHVVQIIGGGSRKYVTLSHRAQVKRFSGDVLRILKSQASKQISILDFPVIYNKLMGKPFQITEYGVCFIEDLFNEIPESTITVTGPGKDMVLSIPKRDQTSEEVERTKQFAVEVIDLLKHSPQCRMPFNKFIPAYHHHFGKQCKVADYGFTKLIELFEAIPYVLQIENHEGRLVISLVDHSYTQQLAERTLLIMMDQVDGSMKTSVLCLQYKNIYGEELKIDEIVSHLPEYIQLSSEDESGTARLAPMQVFARDTRTLLQVHQGKLALQHFEAAYAQHYGVNLVPASYGHPSVVALLQSIPHVVTIRGRGIRRTLLLCHSFQRPMPSALMIPIMNPADQVTLIDFTEPKSNSPSTDSGIIAEDDDKEVGALGPMRRKSPQDLLAETVPSAVPSPEIHPMFLDYAPDLMNFDPSPLTLQEVLAGMTEEEKAIQQTPLCQTPVSEMLQFAAQLLPSVDNPERRPASAESFFQQAMYQQGYAGYTGAQIDDPAVLTDSTQFYANYNANYQPMCVDTQMWYPNMIAAGHGPGAANSMQNIAGAAGWIEPGRPETNRVTVAERFINTGIPPPGATAAQASEVDPQLKEHLASRSLEMAKAMLKDIKVPASKKSAVYAGEKESQSQAAEAIPVEAVSKEVAPASPSGLKSESATEALMRALRACSPNAKVSAAMSLQSSTNVGNAEEDAEDTGEEFFLTPNNTYPVMQSRSTKSRDKADAGKEVGSPRASLSETSSTSGSPVKQGTPRKMRIAARFDVPMEAASDESS